MSRNRKNNHYHYAEQYTDGAYQRRVKAQRILHLPRKAVFFAVLVLLAFGVISTTFSANNPTVDENSGGGIIVRVRSNKIAQDYVADGMDRDDALALTGAGIDTSSVTAARPDLAGTGAYSSFYIVGDDMGWSFNSPGNKMTLSDGGYYYYKQITGDGSDKLFRLKASNSWSSANVSFSYHTNANDHWNVNDIGHGTDSKYWMWDPNNTDGNMAYKANSGETMYLLYYPDGTPLNTSGDGIVCAAKSLPDDTVTVKLGHYFDSTTNWGEVAMTNSNGTWSCSKTIDGNLTRGFTIEEVYGDHTTIHYKDQNAATMTYDHCTDWQFETNNNGNPQLATVITGSYTFSYVFADKTLSVIYPSYTVTTDVATDTGNTTNSASPATTTVAIGSSVQVSATTTDGAYNFSKWTVSSGSAKTGSYASGTDIGSSGNNNSTGNPLTIYPYGTSATVNLRANYTIQRYAITYSADASPATAAAGTITNPATNSVPTGDTKQHGQNYTITSNKFVRPGYTQVGWSTVANSTSTTDPNAYAFGATYSTDSALTLYPVWRLDVPTKTSGSNTAPTIVSNGSMTVGSAAVDLTLDVYGGTGAVHSKNSDILRYYNYTITGPTGHNASVGTDPTNSDTFMKFTASIPGSYTVKITVKDYSKTNVTNTTDSNITDSSDPRYNNGYAYNETNTAAITVYPDAPTVNIEVYGKVDDPERDGTSGQGKAYMVLLGNRYYFKAEVDSTYVTNHPTTDYTYEWYWDDDFDPTHKVDTNNQNLTTITFIDRGRVSTPDYRLISYDPDHTYDPDPNSADPDPRMMAEESDGVYHSISLYCRVTRNSASNNSQLTQKWYFIQPLIKSFQYEPMQKIFNINDQTVSLAAEYNVTDDPRYITKLYFSDDNSNDTNDWTLAEQDTGFIHSFANAIRTYLFPNGPKFFYLLMNGRNALGELIESRSEKVHTTVGTADSVANRTLYFDNSTSQNLKTYLVMCYYIDGNGTLRYQTAQDMCTFDDDEEDETTYNNNGVHYRVMIPSDAQAVRLGFLSSDVEGKFYYGSPTVTDGVISGFTGPTYYGYSEQVELTSSTGRIIFNSINNGTLKEFYYSEP